MDVETFQKDIPMPDTFLDQLKITADSIQKSKDGLLLSGARVSLELPAVPNKYLYSGWQSWSLTAWVETGRPVRPMRPSSLRAMQTDPFYTGETRPHGSWYGAVEMPEGQVLLLGALGLESHVRLDGTSLKGWYEAGQGEWFVGCGEERALFEQYAAMLKQRFGSGRAAKPLRVWCSWYSLYTDINEARLLKILHDLGDVPFDLPFDLPFDVFQVDDGWQVAIGDWEPNARFPTGMEAMAAAIRASGRKAGLWLAPLLVVPSSRLYREHPDWLLRDAQARPVSAGFNWGEQLYALDTTHPAALDWLAALMQKVRGWGYDYVKLDFLYAGALPGQRHVEMPRETAYREGLKVIREALGEAYFLTCGAPVLPSLGLCDGLRVGPDVAGYWTSQRDDNLLMNTATPGTRNALRTTLQRLWLQPLVQTDPDVAYFRTRLNDLTCAQKQLLQDLAQIAQFKATSDVPAWLTESERLALRSFLKHSPSIKKMGQNVYELDGRVVDFNDQIGLPALPDPFTNLLGALIGGLANMPFLMRIFDKFGRRDLEKKLKENPV
jgi:alpha-galactosidase